VEGLFAVENHCVVLFLRCYDQKVFWTHVYVR